MSCVAVLLLGLVALLAGCQNQGNHGGERRDGFYTGVSGGLSRP